MSLAQRFAQIFGAIYLLVGILGFVPVVPLLVPAAAQATAARVPQPTVTAGRSGRPSPRRRTAAACPTASPREERR